ncbi:hypothetical protein B0H13DRAFT_2369979 [Mycena leptocephala]|nr:hypothetical protein B0H13DRAFT_2369979 [Mycena leptocephala]
MSDEQPKDLQEVDWTDPEACRKIIADIQALAEKDPAKLREMVRGAFSGKAGEELVQRVKESGKIVEDVKTAFGHIYTTLVSVDAKKIILDGKPLEAFAPKWDIIYDSFNRIMKDSQVLAATAAGGAQKFADVMIPILCDPQLQKKDAGALLDKYIKTADFEQEECGKIGERLTQLQKDINSFKANLSAVLTIPGNLSNQIETVTAQIVQAKARIDQMNDLLNGCMWSAIGGGIGLVVGMFLTLTPAAPVGIALMMGSVGAAAGAGIAANSFGDQLHAAMKDHAKLQTDLAALVKTQTDLNDVNGKLLMLDSDWKTIANGLTVISRIWGAFRTDLIKIRSLLGDLKDDARLLDFKLLESVYVLTAQMLDQYSVNITAVYNDSADPAPAYKA